MRTGVIEVRAVGPLVRVRIEGSAPSVAHEAAREELAKLLVRGERYGLVLDLRAASIPRLDEQRGLVEVFARHRARMAEECRGVAIVLRGRLAKAALGRLVRFAPTPVPLETFSHAMAAEAWLRERLAAATTPKPV